jgi:hypothetical protein
MQLRLTLLSMIALGAFTAHAGTIYKWKDANGVTHYSDQPGPGSEKVTIDTPNRSESSQPKTQSYASTHLRQQQPPERVTVADYSEFEIYAPAQDATLNESTVSVHIRLTPSLAPRHLLTLYLDGRKTDVGSPDGQSFTLPDVPRGSHSLQAIILDRDSGETKNSNSVSFNIYQRSIANPPRGPLLPQKKKP